MNFQLDNELSQIFNPELWYFFILFLFSVADPNLQAPYVFGLLDPDADP
jgi:hypothetical protein